MITFLKILVLVLSMLTIIGAGHQVMIILPFEVISVMMWFEGEFDFNVTGDYDDRLWMMSQVTFIAQVVLLASFFLPRKSKTVLSITGCLIFLLSIVIMVNGFGRWNPDSYIFMLSLPLFIPTCILLYKEVKVLKELKTT